jgi:hypothetical protein
LRAEERHSTLRRGRSLNADQLPERTPETAFGRSFCFRVSAVAVVDEAGALKTVKALGIAAPSFVHDELIE